MKETGIIMSGNHPQLILEDRKTQTRRVIKPQPISEEGKTIHGDDNIWYKWNLGKPNGISGVGEHILKMGLSKYCPYGQVGDMLWVKETFDTAHDNVEGTTAFYKADYNDTMPKNMYDWKPSIHMPRWASRITLEITEVRVERVQNISINDCIAEGLRSDVDFYINAKTEERCRMPEMAFSWLWDSLNAKRGYGWEVNPFVWCISFRRLNNGLARNILVFPKAKRASKQD